MKTIPFLMVVLIVVLGCGRFGSSSGTGVNNASNTSNATTASKPIVKVVDFPDLIGKTHEEINKRVGQDSKALGSTSWTLPKTKENPHGGRLSVIYSVDKKASMISLDLETIQLGEGSSSGHSTAAQLGQLVGLDIQGTPSTSTSSEKYNDFMVNGKKCELEVGKRLDAYNSVKLYCP